MYAHVEIKFSHHKAHHRRLSDREEFRQRFPPELYPPLQSERSLAINDPFISDFRMPTAERYRRIVHVAQEKLFQFDT